MWFPVGRRALEAEAHSARASPVWEAEAESQPETWQPCQTEMRKGPLRAAVEAGTAAAKAVQVRSEVNRNLQEEPKALSPPARARPPAAQMQAPGEEGVVGNPEKHLR